jgi:hypothetical protein
MTGLSISTERALIRTVAGASRKLDEDLNLSPLQAIDRLQKINLKFREHWIDVPWLVLEDCFTLPAHMPVPKMLAEIAKHGNPIGIVGVAWLKTTNRYTVLQMMFRKDEKSRKTVDRSAQAASDMTTERIRRIRNLHERAKNENAE